VPSEKLHRDTVARLAEQRLDALCRRVEADLRPGRHGELVAELRILTERHPLFSVASRPMSAAISALTGGRPVRFG